MKTALIIGGASCVFDDIEEAYKLFKPDAIFCINDVVQEIPFVDYFCTLHPEKAGVWLDGRKTNGYEKPKELWCSEKRLSKSNPLGFNVMPYIRGGSGMFAILLSKKLGYKAVLAGIPMSEEYGHYFDSARWSECELYRNIWKLHLKLGFDLRSMSGWTKAYYGKPSPEWLQN